MLTDNNTALVKVAADIRSESGHEVQNSLILIYINVLYLTIALFILDMRRTKALCEHVQDFKTNKYRHMSALRHVA